MRHLCDGGARLLFPQRGDPRGRAGRWAGFTLIELMTAVAILAIVTTIAVPGLATFVARQRLQAVSSELTAALALARSEAIQRGLPVLVIPADGSLTVNPYSLGWQLVIDANASGAVESSDTVLRRYAALPERLRLTGPSMVVFSASSGYLTPTSAKVFSLCPVDAGQPGFQVTVAPSGLADVVQVATCE